MIDISLFLGFFLIVYYIYQKGNNINIFIEGFGLNDSKVNHFVVNGNMRVPKLKIGMKVGAGQSLLMHLLFIQEIWFQILA
jgi:hypothetical protein